SGTTLYRQNDEKSLVRMDTSTVEAGHLFLGQETHLYPRRYQAVVLRSPAPEPVGSTVVFLRTGVGKYRRQEPQVVDDRHVPLARWSSLLPFLDEAADHIVVNGSEGWIPEDPVNVAQACLVPFDGRGG